MRPVSRRWLIAAALCASAALSPARAEAVSLTLGLQGHYHFAKAGVFLVDLQIEQALGRIPITVGGRFGGGVAASPAVAVLPLDLILNIYFARQLYAELMGGPWFLLGQGSAVRGHFAAGFGFRSGSIRFGPEIGYLDPDGIIGARLAFSF
jgi:hypothetical protein